MLDTENLIRYLHNLIDQYLAQDLHSDLAAALAPFKTLPIVNWNGINQTNPDNACIGPSVRLYLQLLESLLRMENVRFNLVTEVQALYSAVVSVCLSLNAADTRWVYLKSLLELSEEDVGIEVAEMVMDTLQIHPACYGYLDHQQITRKDVVEFTEWIETLTKLKRQSPVTDYSLRLEVLLDVISGKETYLTKAAKEDLASWCPFGQWSKVYAALRELNRRYPMEFFGYDSVWTLFKQWIDVVEDQDWVAEINESFVKYIESIYFKE